jgi:phosphohistidine phosphatase
LSDDEPVRTLYLLRHAKSSWADPTLPDRERPLAPRGRRDAKRVGEHLSRLATVPELVLCSSARRARETLEPLRSALGNTTSMLLEATLYAASADQLLDRLRAVPDGVASVLVIGHNPGLQDLALLLASAGADLERLEAKFPTAALATLALPKATWGQLSPADAVLDAFVVPKQLHRA